MGLVHQDAFLVRIKSKIIPGMQNYTTLPSTIKYDKNNEKRPLNVYEERYIKQM